VEKGDEQAIVRTPFRVPIRVKDRLLNWCAVCFGIVLVSVGLEMFLTPHRIMPGGIKGIAIILAHVTEMQMGLFLLLINLPFLVFKRNNVARMLCALATLIVIAVLTVLLHPFPPLFENPLSAAIAGGMVLGFGIGLIVRFGWYAESANDIARFLKRRLKNSLSNSEWIMIINLSILGAGGFLFGWNQAIYSVVAFVLAFKSIEFTLNLNSRKMVWIRSGDRDRLARSLKREFDRDIQFLSAEPRPAQEHAEELFFSIPAFKIKKLKAVVQQNDPLARIVVSESQSQPTEKYL
jgi:uncharacterized membrane-anchored protein YitT (DUF2179 family)